jgi:hypothetical protein
MSYIETSILYELVSITSLIISSCPFEHIVASLGMCIRAAQFGKQ